MSPGVGDTAPEFEALYCDGETFQPRSLSAAAGDRGTVLAFGGFVFGPIARNWFRRYDWYGWTDVDGVAFYPVQRAGPYATNAFLREVDSDLAVFADVEGTVADAYDLLVEREHMAGARTARRGVFVLDADGEVRYAYDTDEWIHPLPRDEIAGALESL
jgi:peroxiredoxin